MFAKKETSAKPIHAVQSNYWLRHGASSFPRKRESIGRDYDATHRHSGLDLAVYRDENDEEQRSSALKAHTLAQRDQRLVNPQGGEGRQQDKPTIIPSPLMETFAKPTVIPRGSGNLWKMQLGRLRIWTHYPCSTEFCKGLFDGRGIKGEGDSKLARLRT